MRTESGGGQDQSINKVEDWAPIVKASKIIGLTTRQIYRLVAAGKVRTIKTRPYTFVYLPDLLLRRMRG